MSRHKKEQEDTSLNKNSNTTNITEDDGYPNIPLMSGSMQMDIEGLRQSMKNAVVILPPNLKVNGKHTFENISAIVGFKITQKIYDEVYAELDSEDN